MNMFIVDNRPLQTIENTVQSFDMDAPSTTDGSFNVLFSPAL